MSNANVLGQRMRRTNIDTSLADRLNAEAAAEKDKTRGAGKAKTEDDKIEQKIEPINYNNMISRLVICGSFAVARR